MENNKIRRDKSTTSRLNNKTMSKILTKLDQPKKPNVVSMVMKSLLYLIFTLVLLGFIYMSYKTVSAYTKKDKIESKDDILIIDDWINGMSNEFESDVNIPLSAYGNNYSFSFMVFLNQPIEQHQKKEQVIFKKGSDLQLIVPPLEQNNNRNIFKLIFKLDQPQLMDENNNLKNPLINAPRQLEDNAETTTQSMQDILETSSVLKQSFTNLSNNNIDYFTVQNIHPKETFHFIENEQFLNTNNTSDNTSNTSNTIANELNNENSDENNGENDTETICIKKDKLTKHDYVEIHNIENAKINHITVSVHSNIVDIYKNGQLESSKLLSNLPVISSVPFTFFKDAGLNGFIKSFRYYNRGLSQDDIGKYYIKDTKQKNTLF